MAEILRIDGLQEALMFLGTFPNSLTTKVDSELSLVGDRGAKALKGKAHKLTGKMSNSINKKKDGKLKVSVNVPVGYAGYENNRGNPHNFWTIGTQDMTKDAQTKIPTIINNLIASKGK